MSDTSNLLRGERFMMNLGEEGYPQAFEKLKLPPKHLYGIGNPDVLVEGLAIVGARKATPYGLGCAKRFGSIAASLGVAVISGGAYGCDSAAHRGALAGKGKTLAFLGGGCDQPYPARNFKLFQDIIDAGGAVVSENEWNFPPLPHTFRARNRLIASLSKATLIVEAGLPSGTFSTADEALSSGREVLVVPGAITSPTSKGANRLIYQGALPIVDDESFNDALMRLFGVMAMSIEDFRGQIDGYDEAFVPLLEALMASPMRPDELFALLPSHLGSSEAFQIMNAGLLLAEERGQILRYDDGRYGANAGSS